MVVRTDNELLANHAPQLQLRSVKNPILEKYAGKSGVCLTSTCAPALQTQKMGCVKIENPLLQNYERLKSGTEKSRVRPTTENKLLKLSVSTSSPTRVASPRRCLTNPLSKNQNVRSLQLKNPILSRSSTISFRTRNTLLAPSFTLEKVATDSQRSSEKVEVQENQIVSFETESKVDPLCPEDFANVSPMSCQETKFPSLHEVRKMVETPVTPLTRVKTQLIECVCTSLINNPIWFSKTDETRMTLFKLCKEISASDPEFVLKVAFYTRVELNIRTTCNFLLTVASIIPSCRKFLKKYFEKAIILPSDWIQIAEFYQSLSDPDSKKSNPSLPAALRKVMVSKFPSFDEYQLAKYNKDKSKARKKKEKNNKKKEDVVGHWKPGKQENEEEKPTKFSAPSYSLKFLVRKLHLKKPAYPVMCILGKKYPESVDKFYNSGLEGTWDSALSGKRMKLEVPETWETQVSAKGNIAKTWEDLLDHRKLPFMAMLRNLRNMIKAGISETHHVQVLKTLTNERAVTRSRQFPFRFFSAYEVLSELDREIEKQENYKLYGLRYFLNRELKALLDKDRKSFGKSTTKTEAEKKLDVIRKSVHRKYATPFAYNKELLERYRKALDKAVSIATINNIPPIPGHTVVLCDVSAVMLAKKCTTSKGIGSSRTLAEVGILLGLMCAYSCEACSFMICAGTKYRTIELEKGGILKNLKSILSLAELIAIGHESSGFCPEKILNGFLLNKVKMNNLVILSSDLNSRENQSLGIFLERYKDVINSSLTCFKVDLSGKRPSVANELGMICFSGYSDQILKFIGLGRSDAQLNFINTIDLRHNLSKVDENGIAPHKGVVSIFNPPLPEPWKTVRIFISSTIKDMGCERDILVQKVFPTLRERAKSLRLHVVETDLRWGITSDDSHYNRSVAICLQEVRNCDIFVGILGERYGWIPKSYGFTEEGLEWLEDYPGRRSITELEIMQAAFQDQNKNKACYFYFRDSSSIKKEISKSFRDQFFEPDSKKKAKLQALKNRISETGHHIGNPYQPHWEGFENAKLKLSGLEEFEDAVMHDLWKAVELFAQVGNGSANDREGISSLKRNDLHVEIAMQQSFVGRGMLLSGVVRRIGLKSNADPSLIVVVGKSGSGKTALLTKLFQNLTLDVQGKAVCLHLAHSNIPGSQSVTNMLYRFCISIAETFDMKEDINSDDDLNSLLSVYRALIGKIKNVSSATRTVLLLIDEIDSFKDVGWIKSLLFDGVTVVVTCLENGVNHKALKQIEGAIIHPVSDLTISDKREIVRSALGRHSKKLDESHFNNQLQVLLSKQNSTTPLYLMNVCDMIRTEESFETLGKTLKKLPHDLHGTLKWQLRRTEKKCSNHPGLVGAIFGLIYCSSKWKISEMDLYLSLCLRFSSPHDGQKCLPRALVLNVLHSLRSFVTYIDTDSGKMLAISHTSHVKALEETYFCVEDFLKSCHCTLADYFTIKLKDRLKMNGSDSSAIVDALSRLPEHLASSGQQNVLCTLLIDLNYLHYICAVGLGSKLLEVFNFLDEEKKVAKLGKMMRNAAVPEPWQEVHKFIKSCIHIVSKYPDMIFQEALNQGNDSYPFTIASEILSKCEHREKLSLICMEKTSTDDAKSLPTQTYENLSLSEITTCIATLMKMDLVAFGLLSGKVGILDKNTGNMSKIWIGHRAEITALCFIDKSALLSASTDGMMSVWNVKDGYQISSYKAHNRKVTCIAVRPPAQGASARIFISGSHDNSIAVWNTSKFKLVTRISTASPVNCFDFHPQDPRIAVGLWDASIKIWDVQSSKRIAVIRGHSHAVSSVQYSSCGTYIASCSQFEKITRLWEASSGIPLGNFAEAYLVSPKAITFANGGEYLLGAGDGTNENAAQIAVWNSRLGLEEMQYQVRNPQDYGNALCCKFNADKSSLAVGFHEGYLSIYDSRLPNAVFTKKIHDSAITCVSWTPGSSAGSCLDVLFGTEAVPQLFITGSSDRTLKAVAPDSGSVVAVLEGHSAPVLSVDATSQLIAAGGEDFSIVVWKTTDLCSTRENQQQAAFGNTNFLQSNVGTGKPVFGDVKPVTVKPRTILHGHDGPVSCLAFNSEGTLFISGGRDGKLAYWSIEHLALKRNNFYQSQRGSSSHKKEILPVATISYAHMDWITCCSWNDTSEHIVSGSNDTTLKVWKVPEIPLVDGDRQFKVPVYVLKGHSSGITSVVYKMGCIASSGGEDNSIKIWSHKGVEITSLKVEERTNCCDIALRTENSVDESNDDVEEETKLDWANEVDAEEWKEEHQKQRPGSKMKVKTLSSEMQNINVVSVANNAKVVLWKPLAGKKVNIMNEQAESISHIQVCSDGQIMSRSTNGCLKLWSVKPSGNVVRHNGEVTNIVVSTEVVVTSCSAGFVYIWEKLNPGSLKLVNRAKIHGKHISSVCELFKNVFASASHDGNVAVWAIEVFEDGDNPEKKQFNIHEKFKASFDSSIMSLFFQQSPKGERFLWVSHIDGKCSMITLDSSLRNKGTQCGIEKVPETHIVLGYVSDGDKFISDKGFISDTEKLDLDNSEFVHSFSLANGVSTARTLLVGTSRGFLYYDGKKNKLHEGRVTAILESESTLLTSSYDCTVKLWSKETLKQIGQFNTSSPVTCAQYLSPSEVLYGDSSGMINTLKLHGKP